MENMVVEKSHWHNRPVLVTGATGLLGGWLIRQLIEQRADVVCLVRDWIPQSELVRSRLIESVKAVRGDVCDAALIERTLGEYEIDTVFHLAAQTIVDIANSNPAATFESNIRGTWTILEACRRSSRIKAVLVASSDKAYGEHVSLPYSEDYSLRGRFPYDVSKSCADLIAQSYAATFRLPVAISRCGNLFGGGDLNWNRLVPGTIRSVLHGARPMIRSDGTLTRDYIYVEDGASAMLLLASGLSADPGLHGSAFNFSYEMRMSVLDLVQHILTEMGSPLIPDIRNESDNEIRNQCLSSERARRLLGWIPRYTFREGLQKTIRWYEEFFS